jgi:uncharacterized protein YecT (DUF1311 family)
VRIVTIAILFLVLPQMCHSESTVEECERLKREFGEADKELNEVYAKLMKFGDAENRELLKKS